MESDTPSRTALASAMFRAAHRLLDPPPLLLDDPYAKRMMGFDDYRLREEFTSRSKIVRDGRSVFVTRSRLAEDQLATAVATVSINMSSLELDWIPLHGAAAPRATGWRFSR